MYLSLQDVLAAGWYWDTRNINGSADQDDLEAVTKSVNGGNRGLEERRSYLQAAKKVLNC